MRSLHIITLVFSLLIWSSCEKYLSIEPLNDKLETSAVFTDSASASLSISGIYSRLMNTALVASEGRLAALNADDLVYGGSSDQELIQFESANIFPDNAGVNSLWANLYEHVYQVNGAIEGITSSSGISGTAKAQLLGELRFIRAFLFFYAVNNWGAVPLCLSTDYRINEIMPRSPVDDIYDQIQADLAFARENMPSFYLSNERVRPNKWAATALSARVALYLGDWATAEKLAAEVIDTHDYSSLSDIGEAFLKESGETIWQLYPAALVSSRWTYDGYYFVPSSMTNTVIPNYLIADEIYASFELGDKRRESWIGTKTINGIPYHFPYKYKVRSGSSSLTPSEYTIVFRLAEQYLIRAEAREKEGDLSGSILDLNVIRRRAGLTDLPSDLDKGQVLLAVEAERRHELFSEWGHRWFDLKRTGQIDAILGPAKGDNWQSSDALWPVPIVQLQTNPYLTQNEGY